jgi:hypothetical protein
LLEAWKKWPGSEEPGETVIDILLPFSEAVIDAVAYEYLGVLACTPWHDLFI